MTDEELDEKFKQADANSDNKITAEELAQFFKGRTFEIAHAHAAAGKPDRAKEREAEAIFDMSDETPDNDSYVIGELPVCVLIFVDHLLNSPLCG